MQQNLIKRVSKYLVYSLGVLAILFLITNCSSVTYGIRQGVGQLNVLTKSKPISYYLKDPNFPDSLKSKIELIQEIKQFTVDSLGLQPSESYQKLFDQQGEPLMWMMLASEPYELKPYEWKFPIIGTFTYKGHFEKERAVRELAELQAAGFDTRLGKVAAWSTLGYLNDPILSDMLYRDVGSLSALIIHELTHGTLYIKNNVAFNENLADFVGDYGAVKFLQSKYGNNSPELQRYFTELKSNELYVQQMLKGAEKLQQLYGLETFIGEKSTVKDSLKNQLILEIMMASDTLDDGKARGVDYWKSNLPNNAYFVSFINYQSKQNEFKTEFETKFNRNFNAYMSHLKAQYAKSGLLF